MPHPPIASPELTQLIDQQDVDILRNLLRTQPEGPADEAKLARQVDGILARLGRSRTERPS